MNLEQSLNCLYNKGSISLDRRNQLMQTSFRLPQAQSSLLQMWFARQAIQEDGPVDPLAGYSYDLRLQTHRGDNVPYGISEDRSLWNGFEGQVQQLVSENRFALSFENGTPLLEGDGIDDFMEWEVRGGQVVFTILIKCPASTWSNTSGILENSDDYNSFNRWVPVEGGQNYFHNNPLPQAVRLNGVSLPSSPFSIPSLNQWNVLTIRTAISAAPAMRSLFKLGSGNNLAAKIIAIAVHSGLPEMHSDQVIATEAHFKTLKPMDSSAFSYISEIESLVPVSDAQKAAINAFFVTEKENGRWNNIKRLYLPGWNNVEANSIDLVSLNSGGFSGTMTHLSGCVQGGGGYFNSFTDITSEGLTSSDAYFVALTVEGQASGFAHLMGVGPDDPMVSDMFSINNAQVNVRFSTNASALEGLSSPEGIISFSRKSGVRTIYKRTTSGRSILATATNADAGSISPSDFIFFNINVDSVPGGVSPGIFTPNHGKMGAYGFGLGFSDADDAAFTQSLKTLWESCFGLTLP